MPPHTTKEGQQQFKNKKQPELTENQTVWKSDRQGNKEETLIQTVGGAETGGRAERTRCVEAGSGWSLILVRINRE